MTYQDQAEQYADPALRARIDRCSTEQAHIYASSEDDAEVALARDVIASQPMALNALSAGVIASPNGPQLDEDGALLAAMQSIWGNVALALHPPEPVLPDLIDNRLPLPQE